MADERARTVIELAPGLSVEIAELNAIESMMADDIVGGSLSSARLVKTYAIASIRTMNGEVVVPFKNPLEFNKVAKRLSATQAFTLADKYGELYAPPEADELKNESSAPTDD